MHKYTNCALRSEKHLLVGTFLCQWGDQLHKQSQSSFWALDFHMCTHAVFSRVLGLYTGSSGFQYILAGLHVATVISTVGYSSDVKTHVVCKKCIC